MTNLQSPALAPANVDRAAVAAESAPPGGDPRPRPEALKVLRSIRAEVLDLRTMLLGVREGEVSLAEQAQFVETTVAQVDELFGGLAPTEAVRRLENTWDHLRSLRILADPRRPASLRDQMTQLTAAEAALRSMLYKLALLTVPVRVNRWLAAARPGYALPFHEAFADEVPYRQDRERLLRMLSWAPGLVRGGLVDPAAGLIRRHSRRRGARLASMAVLVAITAAAGAAAAGVGEVPAPDWPLAGVGTAAAIAGWAAVLAGVATHAVVDTAKRRPGGASRVGIPVGDVARYVDARLGTLILGVVLAFTAYLGFGLVVGPGQLAPANGFLLGYSLDSALGLLSATLDLRAQARLAELARLTAV